MKVADGFWLIRKGYEASYPAQPYEIEITENSIKVLATPSVIRHRGQTLGGPNLEITYSSTSENVAQGLV